MKILVFDTTTTVCTAALGTEKDRVFLAHEEMARGQAERLPAMIETLMADAGISAGDLDLIGVTTGPGTFTGVRIGIAAARALSLVNKTPMLAVTSVEAMAHQAFVQQAGQNPESRFDLLVAMDARRSEFYAQTFAGHMGDWAATCELQRLPYHDIHRLLVADRPFLVAGSGSQLVCESQDNCRPLLPPVTAAHGRWLLELVRARAEAAGVNALAKPSPLYLRPPDAKLPARLPGN